MNRHINEAWQAYKNSMLKNVDEESLIEFRIAFYAASVAVVDLLLNELEKGEENQNIHNVLNEISYELEWFSKEVWENVQDNKKEH